MENDTTELLKELQTIKMELQRLRKELDDLRTMVNNIDRNTNMFRHLSGAPTINPLIQIFPPFREGEITC